MFRRLPPLHALAAFEAAARLKSFAKAADELYLTHSAVSHRIRQLEESVGVKLFLRLNRNVVLTPAGETFLSTVKDTLEKLQTASAAIAESPRSRLVVSAAPAFASQWLAHRIADFQAKYPGIELEIQSTSQMANLRSGEVDIGLRYGTGADQWPGYESIELIRDEIFPVASPAYVGKYGPFDRPEDLKRATLLRSSRLHWQHWFSAAGLAWTEPTSGPLFSEIPLVIDAAASAAGVALAPRIASRGAILAGKLVRLFDVPCTPNLAYYAVVSADRRTRPNVSTFIEWVLAEAKEDVYKGVEDSLRRGEDRLRAVIENLPAGALFVDGDNIQINKAAEQITGYSRAELSTLSSWFEKLYRHRASKVRRQYDEDKARGTPVIRSGPIQRKDGTTRYVEFSSFVHESGEVWLLHDISDRKRAEERMQQLAYHDSLTSLANRAMFLERLRHARARAKRRALQLGVLFIDLNGFKQINDDLGHEAGDEVLQEVARRLVACIREEDTVARFGGDEFAVLVEQAESQKSLVLAAERVLQRLTKPITVAGKRRRIGASIGIALYPKHGDDITELLKQADIAMYAAKRTGRSSYAVSSAQAATSNKTRQKQRKPHHR